MQDGRISFADADHDQFGLMTVTNPLDSSRGPVFMWIFMGLIFIRAMLDFSSCNIALQRMSGPPSSVPQSRFGAYLCNESHRLITETGSKRK